MSARRLLELRLETYFRRLVPDGNTSKCLELINEIINCTPIGQKHRAKLLANYRGDHRIDASILLDDLLEEKKKHLSQVEQLILFGGGAA